MPKFRLSYSNRRRLTQVALGVGGFFLALFLLEILARFYLVINPSHLSDYAFRMGEPVPYREAPYFSTDFVQESFVQPGGWYTPEGTRLLIPNDFSGEYFNVVGGRRVTTDQPEHADRVLYFFGGSAVYGPEVPDAYTIPSYLQRLLNDTGYAIRVENMGAISVAISQQVERLAFVDLAPGDIVIFYDGVNDINQSLYLGDPQGWMLRTTKDVYDRFNFLERFRFLLYARYSARSAFVDVFLYPFGSDIPVHLTDAPTLDGHVAALATTYYVQIVAASQYAAEADAHFCHFLQPHIFTFDTHSDYEQQVLANIRLVPRGMSIAFAEGYPVLKEMVHEAAERGICTYDLSYILDAPRQAGNDYFLDFVHVNHAANRIIAEAIFDRIGALLGMD